MLLKVFSIYDSAVKTWRSPLFARSTGEMLRMFTDAVNDQRSDFAKHPSDYILFEVGTWDDEKCGFELFEARHSLGVAVEFLKVPPSVSA